MKVNSKSRTRKIIAVTWIIPIVVASPFVYCKSLAFTIYSEYGVISRQICTDRFDEIDIALYGKDTLNQGSFRKVYFMLLFFIIYLLPSIVILTTCVKIAVSLMQPITVENADIGRKDTRRRHEENKNKVARMVVVIAITFIVSWSPQYLVSIISQLQEESFLRNNNFLFTMLITHLCGFINSCLNPIIYTAMSQRFRRSFKSVVDRIFCCCSIGSHAPYRSGARQRSSNRFTSTMRQTFIDSDGNIIPLNDRSFRNEVNASAGGLRKGYSHSASRSSSSSGGADADSRSHRGLCSDKKVIRKYVFTRNSSCESNMNEERKTPLLDNPRKHSQKMRETKAKAKSVDVVKRFSDTDSACRMANGSAARLTSDSMCDYATNVDTHTKFGKGKKNHDKSVAILQDNASSVRIVYTNA